MYVNTRQQFPAPAGSVLAVLPPDFHSRTFYEAFERSFTQMGMKQVLYPGDLSKRLKLTSYVHERVRSGGDRESLKALLGEKHFAFLMTSISPATLLLVPTEMKLTAASPYTYGDFSFRLYDCATGVLLYRNSFQERAGSVGLRAEHQLAAAATERMAKDIRTLFRVAQPLH